MRKRSAHLQAAQALDLDLVENFAIEAWIRHQVRVLEHHELASRSLRADVARTPNREDIGLAVDAAVRQADVQASGTDGGAALHGRAVIDHQHLDIGGPLGVVQQE